MAVKKSVAILSGKASWLCQSSPDESTILKMLELDGDRRFLTSDVSGISGARDKTQFRDSIFLIVTAGYVWRDC